MAEYIPFAVIVTMLILLVIYLDTRLNGLQEQLIAIENQLALLKALQDD